MRWVPNTEGGWFDLEHGVMYRRGQAQRETTKRRPPIRIPARLLPHLRRWKALDGICTHVIHRDGKPVHSVRRAWANSRTDAGLSPDVIPHTLRHTTATWGMQNGADVYQFAGFLGMSVKMLNDVYGHHHPDHQRSGHGCRLRDAPGGSFEPFQSGFLSGAKEINTATQAKSLKIWWAVRDSNSRHPRCKRGALPTELTALQGQNVPRA